MPISSPVLRGALLVAMLLPAAAPAQRMTTRDGGRVVTPDFVAVAPRGFVATSLHFAIDCAGVRSVEGVPDGWRFEAQPDGESVDVRVQSSGAMSGAGEGGGTDDNAGLGRVTVGLLYRGDYSDCFGVRATVDGVVATPEGSVTKVQLRFADDEQRPGHWKATGAGEP